MVHQLLLHLHSRLDHPWTLAELGRYAGYDPLHLSHLFQRVTGESPLRYLRRLRLERAAFHLEYSSGTSVLRVGQEALFASAEGFSRAFKRTFGVSPRSYPELVSRSLQQALAPPEGLDPEPCSVELGPLEADALQVPSFDDGSLKAAVAQLHRLRPFDDSWQLGGVAQPWGWGPRLGTRDLRVVRRVAPGTPVPPPPFARWYLAPHPYSLFHFRGSLEGTGVACAWLMTVWATTRRKIPGYGPVLVFTEEIQGPCRARIYIPR